MPAPPSQTAPSISSQALLSFELPRAGVVVRPLQQGDVLALEWHGGADLRSFYEEQWAGHCNGERCVLVAIFNDFPIGQVAVFWNGKPTHPQIPDVQSFRVHGIFQGLGIGSRLLAAAENVVLEKGFHQISLAVGVDNAPARRLYERLNYRVVGDTYIDHWHYTNVRGETVHQEAEVWDMVKELPHKASGAGASI